MSLPDLTDEGYLPPGIYTSALTEVLQIYAVGSTIRQGQGRLLQVIVDSARDYPSIKRVLLWGSFVTSKLEPNDLDYSLVVSVDHQLTEIAEVHRRFFVPSEARLYYQTDRNYLLIYDYPLERYIERLDFLCHRRDGSAGGIIEISLRGEYSEN